MEPFAVQSVRTVAPFDPGCGYIADPDNLPQWTAAFKHVSKATAQMATPGGSIEVGLRVVATEATGTIDWFITFPDGSVGTAFSRVIDAGKGQSVYSFVLMPPPVPLEQLEGTLEVQKNTLAHELAGLKAILEQTQ